MLVGSTLFKRLSPTALHRYRKAPSVAIERVSTGDKTDLRQIFLEVPSPWETRCYGRGKDGHMISGII